ncbi:GMP synthase [glutamine-hydrolyzing] [Thelohanellus kitauei]|uniref:GMP synthase (glutamine-hydrolyzing) n=1 Tax=Thelohanellus kitauei TaxID=669202 RepID=A0A0C2N2P5_THEKT|nr:GMP synthase [glutamine-hydrolyzing] [Thelohanellus kitauei]
MENQVDTVLIIDAGSQYCKLIDRTIRNLCVRTVIADFNVSHKEIIDYKYKAIVISGGPASVVDDAKPLCFDRTIFDLGIPILGICYGMQLIVKLFGGKVKKSPFIESSIMTLTINTPSLLYQNIPPEITVLMTHADNCVEVPEFFTINAITSNQVAASISNDETRLYGLQFHPEVDLTTCGQQIFKNFLFDIAKIQPKFTPELKLSLLESKFRKVNSQLSIVVLVSGGVDSTVCALLVNKWMENPKHFIMIDTGLLRENEGYKVKQAFSELGIDVTVVEAGPSFLNAHTFVQRGQSDGHKIETGHLRITHLPEHKRQIIGNTFIATIRTVMDKLGLDLENTLLVQGTLRPDMIESGSSFVSLAANTIKTHHNDSFEARELRRQGKLFEPLMDFHKDDVRMLAKVLRLPPKILQRRPFPGPGLAIRIICQEKPVDLGLEEKFNVVVMSEMIANYYSKSCKSDDPSLKYIKNALSSHEFDQLVSATKVDYYLAVVLLPILTVGVQGDNRSYKNCVVLSSDHTINWNSLEVIARVIPKICTSINRVAYAFGKQISHTVEQVTLTFLSPDSIQLCRRAHAIVEDILDQEDSMHKISQFPIVLIPIHFDVPQNVGIPPMRRSLVLRPFISNDFMTGVPAIPGREIREQAIIRIKDELLHQLPSISRVLYDLTSKPPSTTEWE